MMMRKTWIFSMALLFASPLGATKPSPEMPGWLAGAWDEVGETGRWADEFWTPPRGDIMIGASRIGKDAKLSIFEHSRIMRMEHGTLSFFAQPFGKAAVEFPMIRVGEAMIEFANPAHDYPQRIKYWREGALLKAEVSLIDGSKPQRWSYAPMGAN